MWEYCKSGIFNIHRWSSSEFCHTKRAKNHHSGPGGFEAASWVRTCDQSDDFFALPVWQNSEELIHLWINHSVRQKCCLKVIFIFAMKFGNETVPERQNMFSNDILRMIITYACIIAWRYFRQTLEIWYLTGRNLERKFHFKISKSFVPVTSCDIRLCDKYCVESTFQLHACTSLADPSCSETC